MKKIAIGLAIIFGGMVAALVAILAVIGTVGPETSIYSGRQIPKRFLNTIRTLNLIQEDEKVRYFYSDAMLDIKKGMYFVTDKKLVIYSSEWEEPEIIIPFDQIESLDVEYDDSFIYDTSVTITTIEGMEVYFPISSEKKLDKKFVAAIKINPVNKSNQAEKPIDNP